MRPDELELHDDSVDRHRALAVVHARDGMMRVGVGRKKHENERQSRSHGETIPC
jgi:hypothetical protein